MIYSLPDCRDGEHEPRMMLDPEHPEYVKVQCVRCGLTTGYGTSPDEVWESWRNGFMVEPHGLMEEG